MHRSDRSKIKEYRRTVSRLKKENKRLRARLDELSPDRSYTADRGETSKKFSSVCRSAALIRRDSYLGYLKKRLITASLYSLWMRILSYFRRIRLISTVFKVISSALAIIGTGAFFIVLSASLLIIVPFIILFFTIFLISEAVSERRKFDELMSAASDCSIYVFFPSSGQPFRKGSCFSRTVELIVGDTKSKNFAVIVSPFLISPKSIGGRRSPYYHVLRLESERICIIRRSSFFSFRKRHLSFIQSRVTYVY